MSDINTIVSNVYGDFANNLILSVGTDSKELLITAAGYAVDAKVSLLAIGIAALSPTDPMSWAEFKLKLLEEAKIGEAAFLSVEQLLASDVQSFIAQRLAAFENALFTELVKLKTPTV